MKIVGGAQIAPHECRYLRRHRMVNAADWEALKRLLAAEAMQEADWADFRRAGDQEKLSILAAVGTMLDVGRDRMDAATGILGWNGAGCGVADARFWRDYRDNDGLGRGGLFVGTLHSIPLCEAAIALGVHGASSYLRGDDWRACAEAFLRSNRMARLLVIQTGTARADALLVEAALGHGGARSGEDFRCFCDRIWNNEVMPW